MLIETGIIAHPTDPSMPFDFEEFYKNFDEKETEHIFLLENKKTEEQYVNLWGYSFDFKQNEEVVSIKCLNREIRYDEYVKIFSGQPFYLSAFIITTDIPHSNIITLGSKNIHGERIEKDFSMNYENVRTVVSREIKFLDLKIIGGDIFWKLNLAPNQKVEIKIFGKKSESGLNTDKF